MGMVCIAARCEQECDVSECSGCSTCPTPPFLLPALCPHLMPHSPERPPFAHQALLLVSISLLCPAFVSLVAASSHVSTVDLIKAAVIYVFNKKMI